jgi:amidase
MARTVTDAVLLLAAITGIDQNDKVTLESEGKSHADYSMYLDSNGLRGKRIGIEKKHLDAHPAPVTLFRQAIRVLEEQGATIVEVELFKALESVGDNSEFTVLLYEFRDGVNKYLAENKTRMKSVADVIAFNSANASSVMPWFGQEDLIASNQKGDLQDQPYKEALSKSLSSRKIITELMKLQNLDALCGITSGPSFPIDLVNGDGGSGPSFSTPAAISGFPHITVPMGQVHGLPVGISFFATAYEEPKLISLAYAYEQASKLRRAPRYLPRLPVD